MDLISTDLADGTRKIDLHGRLDLDGAEAIDLKLTVLLSVEQTFAVIDLADVDFVASIGIATLVRGAKAARRRGGNVVLLSPRPHVAAVLTTARIDRVIPMAYTLDEACALVRRVPSEIS